VMDSGDRGRAALKSRDLRERRLPLHYAAGRPGYRAGVPVGASKCIQWIREPPIVFEVLSHFPEACRVVDNEGQLPLHVAIDAAKRDRTRSDTDDGDIIHDCEDSGAISLDDDLQVLEQLLACYPAALSRRDGKTRLFPWQQAAVASRASVDIIFSLLRAQPSVIKSSATYS